MIQIIKITRISKLFLTAADSIMYINDADIKWIFQNELIFINIELRRIVDSFYRSKKSVAR